MNDIDKKIQAALRSDPADALSPGEPNIAEEVLLTFRSRQRWLTSALIALNLAAFIGLVFTAIRFYQAPDVTTQLRWGGAAVVFLVMVTLMKLWFWLEMHKNRILREVKRVELLLISRPQK
ncbi:MAG: hypothetical protein QM715_10665 [Nibricoccus sp.]